MVRHLTAGAVVTALLAIGAAPAMAASPDTKHPPSFSHKAVAKVVASSATPATAPKTTPKQATSSGSFLKTRTGLVVLAVMAVGTGYAMYSAKEDRIRGINR
jgi:hypothetical protein